MNNNLAEETGIHIGDGNLHIAIDKGKFKSYRYGISGDLINECIYYEGHISKLIKDIYNLKPYILRRGSKGCVESYCKLKSIVQFKNKILKLPIGSKKEVKIPRSILKDDGFQKRCIVGIIDADFNITSSLAITGKMNNLFIVKEMCKIFDKNKIAYIFRLYKDYGRFYIRKKCFRNNQRMGPKKSKTHF